MAFCPNLPLPTVQAGAEGPQAAEIKNDVLGTVGMYHPMDGDWPHRHWPPVSTATAQLQENKGAAEALDRGKPGRPRGAEPGTHLPPPTLHLGIHWGLVYPAPLLTGCVSLIPL